MLYNRFGSTGMTVSRLGLGTFLLGKPEYGDDRMARVLGEALERGINLIDTADTYFDSEVRLGKAMAEGKSRDQLFLCTKLYKVHSNEGKLAHNSRANILRGIENSLRRLQTDHLDLYLLHHPDSQAATEETMWTLDGLVKAGKTRYVGCSNHYAWQIERCQGVAERLGTERFSVTQNCYNVVWRVLETEFLHYVRRFGMGLMVYSPLGVGLLTGDYKEWGGQETTGQAGEFRQGIEARGKGIFDEMLKGLMDIANQERLTLSQLAILWLMSKPVVSAALIGATEIGQLAQLDDALQRGLSGEQITAIDRLTESAIYMPYRNQPHMTGGG